jgi:hypothetical protein
MEGKGSVKALAELEEDKKVDLYSMEVNRGRH